jgi:hypothetical protein
MLEAFKRWRNRPWLGSWSQRTGAAVLEWWDERYPPQKRTGRLPAPWWAR